MTEWDKLCNEYEDVSCEMELTPEYIKLGNKWIQVKAVGDKQQEELQKYKNSFQLIKLAGGQEVQLAQKLESIKQIILDTKMRYSMSNIIPEDNPDKQLLDDTLLKIWKGVLDS